jgi:hypothetical protein
MYSIEIKKSSLNILSYLTIVRNDAKTEIKENGIL